MNARGSQALLATLIPESGLPCNSDEILDRLSSLSFSDASVLGLTEGADAHLKRINSRWVCRTVDSLVCRALCAIWVLVGNHIFERL